MDEIKKIKKYIEIELESIFNIEKINQTVNIFEFENYLKTKAEILNKVQNEFLPLLNKYCEKIELTKEQHLIIQNFMVEKTQNLFNKS